MPAKLLTPEEVAERLQLKVKTVERLIERGDIPAELVDGRWVIREEDAREFAANFNH
ncbi:MAG: helix-turn-helix domain-containing protein [Actinobacteria bacterium]|nr:helix-turn-helix domain-containing protein [Actinomycetota bacterium]